MNKLIILMILIAGIGIGWWLRDAVVSVPVVISQAPPLHENSDAAVSATDGSVDNPVIISSSHLSVNPVDEINRPAKQRLEPLAALLNTGQDAEAIEWYVSFERENEDIDSARHLINQQVNRREQRNDLPGAARLLSLFIEQLPHGFDERIALAVIYQRQAQFYPALRILFETIPVASTTVELTQLDQLILKTVKAADRDIPPDDIGAKIKLYQFLIQHRASDTQYYIELAKWQVKGMHLDAAIEQLNIVQYDPFVGDVAQQMLAEIERLRLKLLETPVALVRRGSHFMVDASLNHNDIRLLIDTGASLTVLDSAAAQLLGLHESDILQRMQMNTANGMTEALLYRIDSMALGVFAVSSIDIAVVEHLEVNGASGLLGMNFLKHFEFRIDQSDAQLFLKYRD
ncbi:MAG: retroviral-like aspartic protease family protein [Gammaproteobacteria bacterium]|nr:retroviral-like aspartic protease family protein [Gammaproteobacteria bacterium]